MIIVHMINNDDKPIDDLESRLAEAMETEFFGSAADSFQLIDPIQQTVVNINEPKVVKSWVELEDHKLQDLTDDQVIEDLTKIKAEKEEEEIEKKINSVSDDTNLVDETCAALSSLTVIDHNQIDQIYEMKADLITEVTDTIAALSLSTKNEINFDNLAVFNENGEIIVEDFSLFEFFSRYLAVNENFIMPCSFENASAMRE